MAAMSNVVQSEALNPEEAARLRENLVNLVANFSPPISLAERIYERLFEIAPQVRSMFSPNMDMQTNKLLAMLTTLVNFAGDPSKFNEHLERLRYSHADYGVEAAHYDVLKEVMFHVITEAMGDALTEADVAVWTKFYDTIANHMKQPIN